jgi:hypothetical protein
MNWLTSAELPPFDKRPARHFIRVEGWKEHSDGLWHRVWFDVAFICREDQPDSMLGYRRSDMERIMRDGDMDCIEVVTHWAPASFDFYVATHTPGGDMLTPNEPRYSFALTTLPPNEDGRRIQALSVKETVTRKELICVPYDDAADVLLKHFASDH